MNNRRGLDLPKCSKCGGMAPPGMVVCSPCLDGLVNRLRDTAELEQAITTAQANEMCFSHSPGGSSKSGGHDLIPFNERLSRVAAEWRHQVLVAATAIAAPGPFDPQVGVVVAAEFIADHRHWIQSDDRAPALIDYLNGLYVQVERLIDAPADRYFMGTCGEALEDLTVCLTRIYAIDGHDEAVCSTCGFAHLVYGRRQALSKEARKIALPPTDLARAVDGLGLIEVTAKQISKWHERGKLTPVGVTADGRKKPTFLVGDVLDLVNSIAAART